MNQAVETSFARLGVVVIAALIAAMALMVAAAYLWVFLYSAFIDTSGDLAYYEAYAQRASPIVAAVVAGPIFFLVGRFMRRYGDRGFGAALAVVLLNLAIDVAATATLAEDVPYSALMSLIAAAAKFAGAYLGVRRS